VKFGTVSARKGVGGIGEFRENRPGEGPAFLWE
jgi:hypothetical protein